MQLATLPITTTGGEPPPKSDPRREYVSGLAYDSWFADTFSNLAADARRAVALHGDRLYDAMLLDATVRASINTLKASVLADGIQLEPARQADDEDEPAEDVAKARAIHAFCERALEGLDEPLEDILWGLLDAIPYGCMMAEVTYRMPEEGPDRLKLTLKSVHVKPRSAWNFVFDATGEVVGFSAAVVRKPGEQVEPTISRDKAALFSWMPKARDPRGTPALDAAYEAWNFLRLLAPQYWKYLSLFSVPIRFGTTAPGATEVEELDPAGNPTGKTISPQQEMLGAILNLENSSAAVGAHQSTLTTHNPQGEGGAFVTARDEFKREMVFAILQQVRATVEAANSSKSDSETAQDILGILVRVAKKAIAGVIRKDILKPLVSYNFGPDAAERLCPVPMLGMVDHQDFSRNANAVSRLASVGLIAPEERTAILKWLGLGSIVRVINRLRGKSGVPAPPLQPPQPQPAPTPGKAAA